MSLRSWLLDLLRVQRDPHAPQGDQDIQIFRAAPNYFWYRVLRWGLKNGFGLLGLMGALGMSSVLSSVIPGQFDLIGLTITRRGALMLLGTIEFGALAGYILHAVGSLLLLRLDFEQRWYIVTDRSLRIREGLLKLREQTITFANVQHVSIRQGPVQRLLGIADLRVRTAGGKGDEPLETPNHANPHIAVFRGIANAEHVRDAIRDRLRQHRDAGLGDPDDAPTDTDLLGSALALVNEARLLRTAGR
jgi:membrane protein YdbS with pleckstrin-like domain